MEVKHRKTTTIGKKLKIIAEFKALGGTMSQRHFAATKGIPYSTLRDWLKADEKLNRCDIKKVRKSRNIPRIKKGYFPIIDEEMIRWVRQRNSQGIRVKDSFIQMQARNIRDSKVAAMEDGEEKEKLKAFQASRYWCSRFKGRFNLKSRRHTTTHSLPENFRDLAIAFVTEVQTLCRNHGITRERIINMDQVSRYYENDKSTTIAEKGTKEILLRKSSTSHKKFTYTPFITASGDFLTNHALFSNLKNIPRHDPRCKVDVNVTGMWNMAVLTREIHSAVAKARGLFNPRGAVLVILDSYGVHSKFVNENRETLAERNIYFALVPARLTGLLQPLDVALNRSFQQRFNDNTNEYQAESLRSNTNKTKKGNIKMPTSELVTKWAADWSASKTQEEVRKAFDLCGLVPEDEFDLEKLHQPLRDVYKLEMSVQEWIGKHASIVCQDQILLSESSLVRDGEFAFIKVLHICLNIDEPFDDWSGEIIKQIDEFLQEDDMTKDIYRFREQMIFKIGEGMTYSYIEAYACSKIFNIPLHIIELDEADKPRQRFIFGHDSPNEAKGIYVKRSSMTVTWDPEYKMDSLVFVEALDGDNSESEDNDNAPNNDGIAEDEELEEYVEYELPDDDLTDFNEPQEIVANFELQQDGTLRDAEGIAADREVEEILAAIQRHDDGQQNDVQNSEVDEDEINSS